MNYKRLQRLIGEFEQIFFFSFKYTRVLRCFFLERERACIGVVVVVEENREKRECVLY